mmetsp:Transcript_27555/g.71496  ORF Transcript_27555/g.71496 Transcript_27555/m.71496 type:complete len:474 (-) Transcript_27555:1322-2743(-)
MRPHNTQAPAARRRVRAEGRPGDGDVEHVVRGASGDGTGWGAGPGVPGLPHGNATGHYLPGGSVVASVPRAITHFVGYLIVPGHDLDVSECGHLGGGHRWLRRTVGVHSNATMTCPGSSRDLPHRLAAADALDLRGYWGVAGVRVPDDLHPLAPGGAVRGEADAPDGQVERDPVRHSLGGGHREQALAWAAGSPSWPISLSFACGHPPAPLSHSKRGGLQVAVLHVGCRVLQELVAAAAIGKMVQAELLAMAGRGHGSHVSVVRTVMQPAVPRVASHRCRKDLPENLRVEHPAGGLHLRKHERHVVCCVVHVVVGRRQRNHVFPGGIAGHLRVDGILGEAPNLGRWAPAREVAIRPGHGAGFQDQSLGTLCQLLHHLDTHHQLRRRKIPLDVPRPASGFVRLLRVAVETLTPPAGCGFGGRGLVKQVVGGHVRRLVGPLQLHWTVVYQHDAITGSGHAQSASGPGILHWLCAC